MGYIKEPKSIDFTVLDKEMTEDEKKKLSAYIVSRKHEISEMHKKIKTSGLKTKKALNPDTQE
jgi:hypothetical protein